MTKSLVIIALAFYSTVAFTAVCFERQDRADFLPKELCFEAIVLDVKNEILLIRDDKKILPSSMPVRSTYHPREEYPFTATQVLFNKFSYCTEGLRANLTLDGTADIRGGVYPETLLMKVNYEYSWDVCHGGEWEKGIATYYFKHF